MTQSFVIPRGVGVVASGQVISEEGVLEGDNLTYDERTMLFICGKEFEHVDKSKLTRVEPAQEQP